MRSMATAIVAGAALLVSAALAMAQDKQDKGEPGVGRGGGAPAGAVPRGGGEPRAAPTERAAPPSRAPAIQRQPGPRATAPAARESGRSAEPRTRTRERPAAQAPDRDKKAGPVERERSKAAEPRRQERRKAESRPEKRAAERERDRQQKGPSAAEPKPGIAKKAEQPEATKKAEGGRDGQQAQRHKEVRSARIRLSSEQRSDLRTKLDMPSARVRNAKLRVRVGTHIPRRVRLFAVPAAVVAIVPAYAHYRYLVVDETICIVDPDTYEIVDVIDERQQVAARPERVELRLSLAQQGMVLDAIGPDHPSANVRIRLALGAEIPPAVELHSFPVALSDSIPALRSFRFVVAERDVVIVDPRDRSVALVIER